MPTLLASTNSCLFSAEFGGGFPARSLQAFLSSCKLMSFLSNPTCLASCNSYKNRGLDLGGWDEWWGKGIDLDSHMEVIDWHSLQVVVMETIGDWAANEFMVSTFLDAIRLCPNARWIPGQVSWLKTTNRNLEEINSFHPFFVSDFPQASDSW